MRVYNGVVSSDRCCNCLCCQDTNYCYVCFENNYTFLLSFKAAVVGVVVAIVVIVVVVVGGGGTTSVIKQNQFIDT